MRRPAADSGSYVHQGRIIPLFTESAPPVMGVAARSVRSGTTLKEMVVGRVLTNNQITATTLRLVSVYMMNLSAHRKRFSQSPLRDHLMLSPKRTRTDSNASIPGCVDVSARSKPVRVPLSAPVVSAREALPNFPATSALAGHSVGFPSLSRPTHRPQCDLPQYPQGVGSTFGSQFRGSRSTIRCTLPLVSSW